jgi:hypothetical protein
LLGGTSILGEMAADAKLVQRQDDVGAQFRDRPPRAV